MWYWRLTKEVSALKVKNVCIYGVLSCIWHYLKYHFNNWVQEIHDNIVTFLEEFLEHSVIGRAVTNVMCAYVKMEKPLLFYILPIFWQSLHILKWRLGTWPLRTPNLTFFIWKVCRQKMFSLKDNGKWLVKVQKIWAI